MASPFEIVAQTSTQLVVNSPMLITSWVILVPLIFGDLMVLFVYTQMPKGLSFFMRNLPVWIGILLTLMFVFISVWSHTMTLSREANTAVIVNRFAGVTYETKQIPLSQLERATLESARPGTRIAIVLHGGEPVWPFGKGYNTRPNEYTVIDDINGFLSGRPKVSADEMERRMDDKFKKLEGQEAPGRN